MSTESNAIIFMGLNKSASHEAKALREKGNKVIYIGKGDTADSIKVGNQKYDLSNHNGIVSFVKTLGLNLAQETKLITAIETGGHNIRDELAQLAIIWSDIEKKGSGATRFILSGHSIGSTFWGEDNGMLELDNVKKIAESMPKAAGLIEDLHLSACYSGKENDLQEWRKTFPNVHTIWAYSGSAPGSYSGAAVHMTRWDNATRDFKLELDRSIVAKTRKGESVAVWSKRFGYQSKDSTAIHDLILRITQAEPTYQSYFSGTLAVTNTQTGVLRDYYNDLQDLIGHPIVTATQLTQYRPRLETTIRLIHFNTNIKMKFAQHHATLITNGYKAIGVQAPNFSVLSRMDCVKAVNEFERKVGSGTANSADVTKLMDELVNGLKELRSTHIPNNWI